MFHLLPVLVAAAWGFNVVANRLALAGLDPQAILAWRFLLAALLFLLLFGFKVVPFRAVARAHLPRLLGVALVAVVAGNLALLVGQTLLPATVVAVLLQAAPIFSVLADGVLGTRRITLRTVCVCGIGTAGAVMAVGGGVEGVSLVGLAVTLVAPASVAAYGVLVRPLVVRYGSANVTGQVYIVGGLGFATVTALSGTFHLPSTGSCWGALTWLGAVGTVGSWVAWGKVLARMPAGRAGLYMNLVPVFGLGFAALVLGEPVHARLLLGGVLTVGAVALVGR